MRFIPALLSRSKKILSQIGLFSFLLFVSIHRNTVEYQRDNLEFCLILLENLWLLK